MRRLFIQRLLVLPLLLFGVTVIVFASVHLIPGDPARLLAGGLTASEEQVDEVRAELGFDDALPVQYGRYMSRLARGDLGDSIFAQRTVAAELMDRFPASLELALVAFFFGAPIGALLGVWAAVRRDTFVDNLTTGVSVVGLSIPGFWLSLILIWVFGVKLNWLPFGGQLPPFSNLEEITGLTTVDTLLARRWGLFVDSLRYLFLPAATLAVIPITLTARYTRAAFVEELNQDYVRTARAYGLSERTIVWRYAAKNAMLPIVTLIGILIPAMLGGAILIESVFGWPGIGTLLLQSISSRDYAVVQGTTLVLAVVYMLSNLAVDISYLYLDPRISRR